MNWQQKDKAHIWHPFTPVKTAGTPLHITHAKDCTLFGADGKTYIDAISSWWVNIHGHANIAIANAIAQQAHTLEQVIFAGFTHTPAIALAEKLISILPPHFSKVFFSDDGSTAVEVALKMALQYWHNYGITNKTKIIAFEGAYHGDTFGAMSVAERNAFNAAFSKHLFEVYYLPTPNKNNIDEVLQQFTQLAAANTVAAFIFEPLVQGAAGMKMYDAVYLDQLIAIARKKDILCIADEVMTGFGRTGKTFAIHYLQHAPDIICLSKGITGGFIPLGVTVASQKIYDAFNTGEMEKTFFHGHSYTANPLACAAANTSLEILLSAGCQQQIQNIIVQHQNFTLKIKGHDFVKTVRQKGTILAIELNTKEDTSYFNSIRKKAYSFYLRNGVLLRPLGNVIYIMPPYCITTQELEKVYHVIEESLSYLPEQVIINSAV